MDELGPLWIRKKARSLACLLAPHARGIRRDKSHTTNTHRGLFCISLEWALIHPCPPPSPPRMTMGRSIVPLLLLLSFLPSLTHSLISHLGGIGPAGNVINGLLDREDLIGLGIRDLNGEFILNAHDHLDCVEGVKTQILGKVGRRHHLGLVSLLKSTDHLEDPGLDVFLTHSSSGRVGPKEGHGGELGGGEALTNKAGQGPTSRAQRAVHLCIRGGRKDQKTNQSDL